MNVDWNAQKQSERSEMALQSDTSAPIVLNGVTVISPDVIKQIADCNNIIIFSDVCTLTPDVASQLAALPCRQLSFPKLQSLTSETAMAFALFRGGLKLDGLTALETEVAESLSVHLGTMLSLQGVTELSVEAAEALSNYTGGLSLSALAEDTPAEVLYALALFQGAWLDISRVGRIDFDALFRFSSCTGDIFLSPALSISSEAAKEVISARLQTGRDTLFFNDILPLNKETLSCFANREETLILPGLTTLDIQSAEALSCCRGALELSGLKTLSADAAEWLADSAGDLLLDGLYEVDVETARALSRHGAMLSLTGVECWTAESLLALSEHTGALVISFPRGFSETLARALACHAGPLFVLNTLWIADDALPSLMQHEYGLYIDTIDHLSMELASVLATYQGPELVIQQIGSDEDEALDILSSYMGELVLSDELDDD